jgi:S1-C subfamily serine protease
MRAARALGALALAVTAALAGCGGSGDDGRLGDNAAPRNDTRTTTTRVEVVEQFGKRQGFDPHAIYKNEADGVVTVVSLFGSGGLDSVLGGDGDGSSGVGSGFVVSGDGEIATNAHVVTQGEGSAIQRSREVYVEFADGNQVRAEIVGHDPNADVALLKVDPKGLRLRPLPFGSSARVEVGTAVAAIGSPFGEKQSLSVGVVSAIDRSIESLTEFQISGAIQTDAAINPGNSGGPLVDGTGHVIGINQQIKSRSGGGEGVGFAVPSDVVKRSLDKLRQDGKVDYAFLGVQTVALYPQLSERFGLPVDKGAWVQATTAGGPGDKSGLEGGRGEVRFQARSFRDGGDIITKVGDKPVRDADDLSAAVQLFNPGQKVKLEVWRDGKRREIEVELGKRPLSSTTSGK